MYAAAVIITHLDVSQKDNSRAHVKTTGYFRFKG